MTILNVNMRRGRCETVEGEALMSTLENVQYKSYKCKYEEVGNKWVLFILVFV